ncbi:MULTISPECIES: Holliday junction branch migration protein RuvA [unclassified Granulicatella]|uniref:Holliday junction branch migration protein RuvA n=1 Tax=unclassified Granulicatella TaxID=2630493 RepID=UPI0010732693|nr:MULTISPECIES: Holliday junction branch migration protein RuvA [unclassified Granulicatella]MBF0780801.1 Holliday junction branch migration protein RuvA [Granulicatella sp. 19428wC4_WM01]TFU93817.1 Holliday junction branch migration protein RuvA [Granulicatella sp. WM01]
MYEYIVGLLVEIQPTYIVVETNGIGYLIYVANPFSYTQQIQQTIKLFCYDAVREESITLYGFKSSEEKQLFLKLISVSGIGPKSALSILASQDHQGLIQAIENDNVNYLTKFPGVGKKTAGQLILDLKGKLDVTYAHSPKEATYTSVDEEVKQALLGLGYSVKEIQKVLPLLEKETFTDTASALSRAFQYLLKTK